MLGTLREIPDAYAHHWKLLIGLAVIVLLPQTLVASSLGEVNIDAPAHGEAAVKLAELGAAFVIGLLGEALYAGVITIAVLDWRAGVGVPGPRGFIRAIPVRRLIAVDLLIAFGAGVGFLLLIVPGIIFLTLTLLAPVLIEVERLGVLDSIRRSAQIVRGNFLRVCGLLVLVVLGTEVVSHCRDC